ncbi:MAG: hypothetical protein OEZ18_03885 [Candidatus Bathyarchaeota archaeon]|nr:hypothetical protein [Candidatus Bathyarchaeota archaeon]
MSNDPGVAKVNFWIDEVHSYPLEDKFVVVINYTTSQAGHPSFALDAVERHTAVIMLTMKGEVVSALCVWGSLHQNNETWDFVNRRWTQK